MVSTSIVPYILKNRFQASEAASSFQKLTTIEFIAQFTTITVCLPETVASLTNFF